MTIKELLHQYIRMQNWKILHSTNLSKIRVVIGKGKGHQGKKAIYNDT